MYILFSVKVERKKYNFKKIFIFGMLVSCFMFFFFKTTYGIDYSQVLGAMAAYSDYTRNAIILFNKNYCCQYGYLLLETEIYSRIPRFIWEAKPADFGYLRIAKDIFPKLFYMNQGAPAFGFGSYYADFGYFSHLFIFAIFSIKGCLLALFTNQLKIDRNIYVLIPFLFLCGVGFIPTGLGWLFWEHIATAIIILFILILWKQVFHANN
ncbi:polymerase [Photorhabdus caribbeanensis]|nr:polymerase [Photorhabdus caribbeanensis]